MKQITLAETGFELVTKRSRKREFLDEMNLVVPWRELVEVIQPFAPSGKTGRPPFAVETILRIHFLQPWFGLSDPAVEENVDKKVQWHMAIRPGKIKALKIKTAIGALKERMEKLKASVRAKVEHPFRVIKCQFGYRKTRYRGLAKNTAQLITLFALSNLWMVRKRLIHGAHG
jgi:IS5 family transposase